jgi:hypothetical protein
MIKVFQLLERFRKDESGNASIELLIAVPIMLWALLSTMVYFDAYHDEAISTRAGLTIADMLSRETANITPAYLTNLRALLRGLTETDNDPGLRVTVFECFRANPEDDCRYDRIWSRNRGLAPNHNNTRLRALSDRLPTMASGDQAILVETETEYNAEYTVSISPFIVPDLTGVTFNSFTVISPRDLGLCWESTPGDPVC